MHIAQGIHINTTDYHKLKIITQKEKQPSGYQQTPSFSPLHLSGKQTPGPLQNPIKQMSFAACLEGHQFWAIWAQGKEQIPKLRPSQGMSCRQSIFYGITWFVHLTLFLIQVCWTLSFHYVHKGNFKKYEFLLQDYSEYKMILQLLFMTLLLYLAIALTVSCSALSSL